jgi:hypothetical protein
MLNPECYSSAMRVLASIAVISALAFTQGASRPSDLVPDVKTIVNTIGSEADARAVFLLVFSHLSASASERSVLESQVRADWVPDDVSKHLARVSHQDAANLIANCGVYWVVSRVERTKNDVSLWLTLRCSGRSVEYVASLHAGQWRLGPSDLPEGNGWAPGMGAGFAGGRPPECQCHGR